MAGLSVVSTGVKMDAALRTTEPPGPRSHARGKCPQGCGAKHELGLQHSDGNALLCPYSVSPTFPGMFWNPIIADCLTF